MTLRDDVCWLHDAADSMLHGALPLWPRTWSTKEGEHLGTMVRDLHDRWFRLALQKTTWEARIAQLDDQVNGLRATNERLTDEQLAFGAFFMAEATRTRLKRIHVALARLERITDRRERLHAAAEVIVRQQIEREKAVNVLAGSEDAGRVHFVTRYSQQPCLWLSEQGFLHSKDRLLTVDSNNRAPVGPPSDAAQVWYDMQYSIGRCHTRREALRKELVRLVLESLPGGPRP